MTLHVAVLNGGSSLEREVSLSSGSRVTTALESRGHKVTRFDVGPQLISQLDDLDVDVAFLALHGSTGEDGTVQALLELIGLPHTGADAQASSLAWDKQVAKDLCRRAGLAVPGGVALSQAAFRDLGAAVAMDRMAVELGCPMVVRPAKGGSALGVAVIDDPARLPSAIVGAFCYGDRVLVETFIAGTEVAVTILDDRALPPVEIVPVDGIYDFTARYTPGATDFHAPGRLEPAVAEAASTAALTAAAALGIRHICRVDMIITDEGVPTILEIDTGPGLTATSLVPLAARAAGISFEDLCDRLVGLALDDVDS